MPRKGSTLSGWYEVIRGPRPKSEECRVISNVAPSVTRLVASRFRTVQAASSTEVAARHNSTGQPGRCEGSSTTPDREVAERVGCIWRDRVFEGLRTSSCVEGSRTDNQRTSPRCSSRGMSGVHQTFAEPLCSVGGGTSENRRSWTPRWVAWPSFKKRWPSQFQSLQLRQVPQSRSRSRFCFGGREVEVTHCRVGDGTGGGTEETLLSVLSSDLVGGPNLAIRVFNSICPHGLEWIAWGMQCGLPFIQILEYFVVCGYDHVLRSAMTTCSAVPCWASCWKRRISAVFCFSCPGNIGKIKTGKRIF